MLSRKCPVVTFALSVVVLSCCPIEIAPIPPAPPPVESPAPPVVVEEKGPLPPVAKVENVVDEFFGQKVNDPYRYMENMKDPYVQEWFKGQADYTSAMLATVPGREALQARLKELDQNKPYQTSGIYRDVTGALLYQKRIAGENVSKLYFKDAKTKQEKLLVDPEAMKAANGQHFSLDAYTPSPNLKYVVYGLAAGGSEETVYSIVEVASGKVLDETIDRIETAYNSPTWSDNSQGFYYSRRQLLPKDAIATDIYKKTKVYFHKVGTSQDADILVAETGLSARAPFSDVDFPSLYLPANSPFAVMKIKHGDSNPLTLFAAPKKSLLKKDIPWVKICDVENEVTSYDVFGDQIYLVTSAGAPRYQVVKTSLAKPNIAKATVFVPQGDYVVDGVAAGKDALYVAIMDGGVDRVIRSPYNNPKPTILELPGQASGFVAAMDQKTAKPLIYTTGWTKGSKIYEYNPKKGIFTDSGLMPEGKFDNIPGFSSKEVKVTSHDGVMVPLSVIYPENIKLDGTHPALLIGYGSYGMSSSVYFSATRLAWLERGGVIAIAHVRGGGELGRDWHLAGQKNNKPNTWKDFIACGEYLIAQGYTTRERLAGQGGSAGGITIGRAITERPDLFRAAIINVGMADAIRAETTTNGVPNIQEYGTVKDEKGFQGLLAMSAYHQVKDGIAYPATLLTHGINDPRVDPWNSGKMAARLQAATAGDRPILLRVDYEAGHGIGSRRDQILAEMADEWSFLLWQFAK